MKSLNQYIIESKKVYPFRLKFAVNVDNKLLEQLESILQKYNVISVSKATKTIMQKHPMDFANLPPSEIFIVDVVFDYPVTSHDLSQYIQSHIDIAGNQLVVRDPNHPEEVQNDIDQAVDKDIETESLLNSDYEESENSDSTYGDEYNKALLMNIDNERKERIFDVLNFEKDPSDKIEYDPQAFNDMMVGTKSPVGS